MGRIFGGRDAWVRISNRFRVVQSRSFCTNNKPTTPTPNPNNNSDKVEGSLRKYDAYRDLDKLDFMTAAKILFIHPPKNKKFGLDFHLVQFFFVCMPPLAVFLVAQYARYEMRRMEAEVERKKQLEEAAKAKAMELKAAEEKAAESKSSNPELLEVKVRLDKLEEAVKEIVVESKKPPGSTIRENRVDGNEKATHPAADDHHSKQASKGRTDSGQRETSGSAPVTDTSQ